MDKLRDLLNEKAAFIAGNPSAVRDVRDPETKSAIDDAFQFLVTLPEGFQPALIDAGTTAQPNHIISLTWLIPGYEAIKSVYVAFKGRHLCDFSLPGPHGRTIQKQDVSIRELSKIDIPKLIQNLMTGKKPHNSLDRA